MIDLSLTYEKKTYKKLYYNMNELHAERQVFVVILSICINNNVYLITALVVYAYLMRTYKNLGTEVKVRLQCHVHVFGMLSFRIRALSW